MGGPGQRAAAGFVIQGWAAKMNDLLDEARQLIAIFTTDEKKAKANPE